MQLHWHENPKYRFAPRADLCDDPAVQRNIGRLVDYGWSFDLPVFTPQMEGAARLADACPKVTFVLQHAGMMEDADTENRAYWRDGMTRLAARPNVFTKLSGLGTFLHRNDERHIASVVAYTVAPFGADRCLFGSNFPIESLWTRYSTLVTAYENAVKTLPPSNATAILAGTARRKYRL